MTNDEIKAHMDILIEEKDRAIKSCKIDIISRADVIEAIADADTTDGTERVFSGKEVIKLIKALPSVQPQRPKGKWIEVNRGIHVTDYRCSECGRIVRDDTGYDVSADYPYCHCGAEMEVQDADSD